MLEFTLGPIRTQADDSIGNRGSNDISLRWRGSETLVERKLLPRSRCDIPPHYSKAEIGFLGFTQRRIMPNDADGPKSKNTRKRGQNVKNGCVTCKIRRKKCDQTRPACIQCTSTGRTCDFLSSPTPNYIDKDAVNTSGVLSAGPLGNKKTQYCFIKNFPTPKMAPPPPYLNLNGPDDIINFEYFQMVSTREFSAYFNTTLWEQIILKAAHTEPFVLHAALAIGSLSRHNLQAPAYMASALEYSMKKYSLASKMLGDRMRNGTADWKLAVLGSLMFLAIEVLQGHELGALMHIRSGEAIIKGLPSSSPDLLSTLARSEPRYSRGINPTREDSKDLVTAYTRLSVEYPFLGFCGSTYTLRPSLPLKLITIEDARTTLNSIVAAVHIFFRRYWQEGLKTLPLSPLPDVIATELSDIQISLQSWREAMDKFISAQKELNEEVALSSDALSVQHLVTWIKTSTYFFKNQLLYDNFLPQFEEIVDVTTKVVHADHSAYLKSRGPCCTLDIAMAQPLFFVACRCRDTNLRRRAIAIMKLVGKEGIYPGKTVAKVAEWVVANEEKEDSRNKSVGEERRFHDVSFEFDMKTRMGRVWGRRRSVDGVWEQVSGLLDLSR
ncbi:hypothetical protein V502_11507 [Pseudogymnoascus sp. VKM F-4520 (FW-2644)]|nr:hypothetical protein V502_11507 [Pseudogymnoascus sp. VKM F-4520 (FW-2644)]